MAKQLSVARELEIIYGPIEDPEDQIQNHGQTPKVYLEKSVDYQATYLSLESELQQETRWIQTKLLGPAMDAKESIAPLKKTIKRRENCKLDFERFQTRVDHLKQKGMRNDDAALMKHEADLAQAITVSRPVSLIAWTSNTDHSRRSTMESMITCDKLCHLQSMQ